MAGRVLGCCAVALLLHLTCVSAVQRLNNINDLRRIPFGQSVSTHSLHLLHWFANQVDMRHNFIQLGFDPNSDYGAHYYGNYERLLPQPPPGFRYYTVGNVDIAGAERLPLSVQTADTYNRARIIFSANRQTIGQVYLTQHHGNRQDSSYDPNRTHEISPCLMRELSQLPTSSLNQLLMSNYFHMQSLWSNPARHTLPAPVEQSQGTSSILDIVKWVFVIVILAVFLFITALSVKPPLRY